MVLFFGRDTSTTRGKVGIIHTPMAHAMTRLLRQVLLRFRAENVIVVAVFTTTAEATRKETTPAHGRTIHGRAHFPVIHRPAHLSVRGVDSSVVDILASAMHLLWVGVTVASRDITVHRGSTVV